MFNVYLPRPLYESLPWIYLFGAVTLTLMEQVSAWRWVTIVALLLAWVVTLRLRRRHRRSHASAPSSSSSPRSREPGLEVSVRDW